jgi:hypothetical protein
MTNYHQTLLTKINTHSATVAVIGLVDALNAGCSD